MTAAAERPSARRAELLERAYAYVLERGLAEVSLRPLAAAIGSSPRVLLFLFGSKDGLLRALLQRARADELALLDGVRTAPGAGLVTTARAVWGWLCAPEHRSVLILWTQAYARSLTEPDGPWSGFARATVDDWLSLLSRGEPGRAGTRGAAEEEGATLALAVLRGALLDLLATGDVARTTAAVELHLATLPAPAE